jgi:hypothetical protein
MITTPAKKTEHQFRLLSFPVGGSLRQAEVGHFRKAPKPIDWPLSIIGHSE